MTKSLTTQHVMHVGAAGVGVLAGGYVRGSGYFGLGPTLGPAALIVGGILVAYGVDGSVGKSFGIGLGAAGAAFLVGNLIGATV